MVDDMWAKLKALPWLVTLGAIIAAVLIAMAGGKIRRLEKRAAKRTDKSVDGLNSNISSEIHKGKVLAESASRDLDRVADIKKLRKKRVEAQGDKDEDIDDIMHRFNSKRVRK